MCEIVTQAVINVKRYYEGAASLAMLGDEEESDFEDVVDNLADFEGSESRARIEKRILQSSLEFAIYDLQNAQNAA